MRKIFRLLLLLLTVVSIKNAAAQNNNVFTGQVTNASGPLEGVSVIQKDVPANGVTTDQNGNFRIVIRGTGRIITVQHVGFATREINLASLKSNLVNVVLQSANADLDDVVVVGYGQKKIITNIGSVSTVKGEDIRDVPTTSVQNTLSGRMPGFFSTQTNGQPGPASAAEFYIRGTASLAGGTSARPLIMVDDIEYNYDQLAQINSAEIASITILKDASATAIYGVRGANGVLIVTTRRGSIGKPRFNFTGEKGMQWMVNRPEFLDAYTTALLRNEALANDGLPAEFSNTDLELFKNGQDPYGHPNVNWMDVLTRKITPQSRYNLDVSGGTQLVKYMISLGYLDQSGVLRSFSDPLSEVDNNYSYKRFNFRSNIDLQASKTLKLTFDMSGRIGVVNTPNTASPNQILSDVYKYEVMAPYAYPVQNPDGSYPYNTRYGNTASVLGRLRYLGYLRNTTNDLNVLVKGTQDLRFITKGLSVAGNISYSSGQSDNRNVTRSTIPSFSYNAVTGKYTPNPSNNPVLYRYPRFGVGGGNAAVTRVTNLIANINYDRSFSATHHVYGLLLFNQRANEDGVNKSDNLRGYTFRAGYDFKQKYLIEFSGAYNGTNQFLASNRYGFFPVVSVGYNLGEEKFFKKAAPFFQLFKMRASYGLTGNDRIGAVPLAEQVYTSGSVGYFGQTNTNTGFVRESALANPNITWEKQRNLNLALDMMMFKGKLNITAEYFRNYRYDQLITRGGVLQIIGIDIPRYNLGEVSNRGWEISVGHQGKMGKLNYTIDANISYAANTVEFIDEPYNRFTPWLMQTGRSIRTQIGYVFDGFWQSQEEIQKLGPKNIALKSGDLKYKDLNSDGVLDNLDRSYIGKPNLPSYNTGMTIGLSYKNFSANVLLQSAFAYSYQIWAHGIDAFNSNLQPIHLERWTINNPNPGYPRLTTNNAGYNSSFSNNSTYWLLDGGYIRIKSFSAQYTLPGTWVSKVKLKSARVYGTAYNFFSWYNNKRVQQDAETGTSSGGNYPNMGMFNFGVGIGF